MCAGCAIPPLEPTSASLNQLTAGASSLLTPARVPKAQLAAFEAEWWRLCAQGGDAVTLLELPGAGHYELITPSDPTWPYA